MARSSGDLRIRDLVDELRGLRQQLGPEKEEIASREKGQTRSQTERPVYTSGPTPITLADTEWQEMGLPFAASEVAVTHTDDTLLAFEDPHNKPTAQIPLSGAGSFTIGGQPPLGTANVWVRKADTATTNPEVVVVVY